MPRIYTRKHFRSAARTRDAINKIVNNARSSLRNTSVRLSAFYIYGRFQNSFLLFSSSFLGHVQKKKNSTTPTRSVFGANSRVPRLTNRPAN